MKFFSTTELQKDMKRVWAVLEKEKQVLITQNGKPVAVLTESSEDLFERQRDEFIKSQFKASLDATAQRAKASGMDKLSYQEIDAIIKKMNSAKA